MRKMRVELGKASYDVLVGHQLLADAGKYLNLKRKALIVTDTGVPAEYALRVKESCDSPVIVTIPQGEESKCLEQYARLLKVMLEHNFSRKDCVVAVGGGVVGDLSGFVAASYMRGVDFYNIPTTTLSQVDSSIGGKVAIDFEGVKNVVGAFYQPKRVLVDIDTLKTQDHRQFVNGLAEAIKTGLIYDEKLFEILEKGNGYEDIEEVIYRSLLCKKDVVEKDEKEQNLRKILNFGHTLGHAIESSVGLGSMLHGECVAVGMVPMCDDSIKDRVIQTLKKYDLPVSADFDLELAEKIITHDKKNNAGTVSTIKVKEIGQAVIEESSIQIMMQMLREMKL